MYLDIPSGLGLFLLSPLALAILLPPTPEGLTTIPSNLFPGVSISYKQACLHIPRYSVYNIANTRYRPRFARQLQTSRPLVDISIFLLTLSRNRITLFTPFSGSSRRAATILRMRHSPFGYRVALVHHQWQQH